MALRDVLAYREADNMSWEDSMHPARLALWVLAASLVWGLAQADQINFKADLSGASEVPPVTSSGKGSATASLDTATKTLTWTVIYSGLSGPPTSTASRARPRPRPTTPASRARSADRMSNA